MSEASSGGSDSGVVKHARAIDLEPVAAGDVVFIPAHVAHSNSVLEAPFEFLCIVPNRRDSVRVLPDDS